MEKLLSNVSSSRIGVFVSAGTDSTILLYRLLKENLDDGLGKSFTLFCIPKHDGAANYIHDCVNAVCDSLGIERLRVFILGDPDMHHAVIVRNVVLDVIRRKIVDDLFLATNITPPLKDAPGLEPFRKRAPEKNVHEPFFELTKDKIVSQYFDLGVENLLVHTHTCTEQVEGACWKCWQCTERIWAFEQINRHDPLRDIT